MYAKILLLLFLCALASGSKLPEGMKSLITYPKTPEMINLCNRYYKLDNYIQDGIIDVGLFKIPEHACFIKCLFENLELWTPDGQPNKKMIKQVFNITHQEKIIFAQIDVCVKKVKTVKECQRVFEVKECVEELTKYNIAF